MKDLEMLKPEKERSMELNEKLKSLILGANFFDRITDLYRRMLEYFIKEFGEDERQSIIETLDGEMRKAIKMAMMEYRPGIEQELTDLSDENEEDIELDMKKSELQSRIKSHIVQSKEFKNIFSTYEEWLKSESEGCSSLKKGVIKKASLSDFAELMVDGYSERLTQNLRDATEEYDEYGICQEIMELAERRYDIRLKHYEAKELLDKFEKYLGLANVREQKV